MKHILWTMMLVLLSFSICEAEELKLTIITDEWPPYEFKSGVSGEEYVTGFSTEVIRAVLQMMNVGINDSIRQYPWVRAEKMIREGTADLLYSGVNNEVREKETYYSYEPLIDSSWSFFIRKEDEGKIQYETLDDFKGQTIGIVRGYAYPRFFWDYIKEENSFEETHSNELNIKKLIEKRFDIIIMDYINGISELELLGLSDKICVLPKPLQKISLYAIFNKNTMEKEFVDQFSAELRAFKTTEEYTSIYEKYIGE